MTYDQLNTINEKFQAIFGVSVWRYLDEFTGFNIIFFENEKCPDILDGMSTKQYVRDKWGKEAVELVETCLDLGSYSSINSKLEYRIVKQNKKLYMGAIKCVIELPIYVRSRYNEPFIGEEFDAYVVGPFAAIKKQQWSIIHLPSKMSCGIGFDTIKEAIQFMNDAAKLDGIDKFPLSNGTVKELYELVKQYRAL